MDNDKKGFAHGHAALTLSEHDVATAVEYWLNREVLRRPCKVEGMGFDKNTPTVGFGPQRFNVSLREVEEEAQTVVYHIDFGGK